MTYLSGSGCRVAGMSTSHRVCKWRKRPSTQDNMQCQLVHKTAAIQSMLHALASSLVHNIRTQKNKYNYYRVQLLCYVWSGIRQQTKIRACCHCSNYYTGIFKEISCRNCLSLQLASNLCQAQLACDKQGYLQVLVRPIS